MSTFVQTTYRESEFGVPTDLLAAGTSLENPYAYDSAARELKSMAEQGLVKIVDERVRRGEHDQLINHIRFARLR
ncbi:MAG: hypothetical protein IV105_12425 [Rhizobacter sp.]|nr:hypothetical protein [Rhizobacter sp.]